MIQDNTKTTVSDSSENTNDVVPTHTCGMIGEAGGCGGNCGASTGSCGCSR